MILRQTEEIMARKMAEGLFDSYAVLVGVKGREAILTSPNVNTDTYFDVASMGKVLVTSTLVLQAVGEGRISLDDSLERYFPDVPTEKRGITVRQLLTHTSGIVRIPIPEEVAAGGRDAVAAHILAHPLAYVPDTDYIYSCNGYILLGYILEMLYGMSLDTVFEERLKKPLGLTRSRFNIAVDEPNAALCYYRAEVGNCRVDDENVYTMGGVAGSGASFWTAADIRCFVRAVMERSDRLYSRELFDLAERNYTSAFAEGRGLGYQMVDEGFRALHHLFPIGSFGHIGATGQAFFVSREEDMYVILLTNLRHCIYHRFTDYADYKTEHARQRADIHNAILRDLREQALI